MDLTSGPVHSAELEKLSGANIPSRKIGISVPDTFRPSFRPSAPILFLFLTFHCRWLNAGGLWIDWGQCARLPAYHLDACVNRQLHHESGVRQVVLEEVDGILSLPKLSVDSVAVVVVDAYL